MIEYTPPSIEYTKGRHKRLKVISACNECRRKKTKCNGEKPCSRCLKSSIECKYSTPIASNTVFPNKKRSSFPMNYSQHRTLIPQNKPQIVHSFTKSIPPPPPLTTRQQDLCTLTNTIQSIEGRLGAIEDILYTLLQQQSSSSTHSLPSKKSSSLTIQNLLNNTTTP